MSNGHTPGPWNVDQYEDGSIAIRPNEGFGVARVDFKAGQNAIANAHLLAAAPDMLEVLGAIAALADGQGRTNLLEVAGMARAAIAKAKGEQK